MAKLIALFLQWIFKDKERLPEGLEAKMVRTWPPVDPLRNQLLDAGKLQSFDNFYEGYDQ